MDDYLDLLDGDLVSHIREGDYETINAMFGGLHSSAAKAAIDQLQADAEEMLEVAKVLGMKLDRWNEATVEARVHAGQRGMKWTDV